MTQHEQVIIVGGGPAGYTAALYTARANLYPLVIEGFMWGGLLQETTDVENYPGYPTGILGPQMMQEFRDQAERFGARFITEDVTKITPAKAPDGLHQVLVENKEFRSPVVILSMGARHRKLGVPGEDELSGRGVSYCATCDAAFFRDKKAIIVGGGDSAMEEAIFLAKFASQVTIVHRRGEFRASPIMFDRAQSVENIEFQTPYRIEQFIGEGTHGSLSKVELANTETGEKSFMETDAAFIAVGHDPQSEIIRGVVELDDEGYVITEGRSTRTKIPGVFAAGDLVDHTYRQAVTAAGSGCMAALDAEWYLRDNPDLARAAAGGVSVPLS